MWVGGWLDSCAKCTKDLVFLRMVAWELLSPFYIDIYRVKCPNFYCEKYLTLVGEELEEDEWGCRERRLFSHFMGGVN